MKYFLKLYLFLDDTNLFFYMLMYVIYFNTKDLKNGGWNFTEIYFSEIIPTKSNQNAERMNHVLSENLWKPFPLKK